ncbi:hypothetical protein [Deinococcus hopiensis]|uniref:Uncharacterized protein n=1 Tax=Deinococcus hopiensis KR-140 TaxID=695939 RepID=A0A1W1V7B8_9DEIO|nr:hypothetical protein [Deinococcus hopiensis]SMB89195.1 hypothetical protein SAMN00790413_00304 [Deinococcus hopiensis KR-140]
MRIETNERALDADLERLATVAGNAATEALRASLDDEGTGRHYPHLPHQSSREGEYPSYQFGDLLESVAFEVDGTTAHVGAIQDPPDHAFWLHVVEESAGGRPFCLYAMHDRQHRQDIETALREGR